MRAWLARQFQRLRKWFYKDFDGRRIWKSGGDYNVYRDK